MENMEISNTYYKKLTDERREEKIKHIVLDPRIRQLLSEKDNMSKMGQLVEMDINEYKELLIANKIDPINSLYSIHFNGYMLKNEYSNYKIKPEYLLIPTSKLDFTEHLKIRLCNISCLCLGDFLDLDFEKLRKIDAKYGCYDRNYIALEQYRNNLCLYFTNISKDNNAIEEAPATEEELLKRKKELLEYVKSIQPSEQGNVLVKK